MSNYGHKGGSMRSVSGASLAAAAMLVLVTAVSTAGCGKVGELKARKNFKAANQAYAQQDWKRASDLYEETVRAFPDLEHGQPYFYLGNAYDNLWKPSKKGEPENDAYMTKAVENYQKAAEMLATSDKPKDKDLGKLALQYLVAAYGADKLNDPAKAEPVVQKMIQLEPNEPTNYFQLSKIYEDAGAYPEAEQMLMKAKEARPNDPQVYMQLARYYNAQNEFDKTIDALEQRASKEPTNPEAYFTIATYYWDNANKNYRLNEAQKRENVQKGLVAINKALELKPDYVDAMVYKGLLLRLQANLEKDPKKQQELLKEAIALHDKAEDLRKKRATGVTDSKPDPKD